MKFARSTLLSLAVVALLASCGTSSDRTTAPNTTPTLDNTAPPSPEGLSVTIDPMVPGGTLTWLDSTAPDVARYQVFEYSPDPARESAYVLAYESETPVTGWTLPGTAQTSNKFFRVRAVDVNGNTSPMSSMIQVSPWAGDRKHDPGGPGRQPFDG